MTATVAPGGLGKSSLIAAETLAQVSGKDLLGVTPKERLRVWLWNLEDPQEETQRKIQAVAKHYGLTPEDIGNRLFVDSGRDQPLVIATMTRDGAMIVRPVVDALVAEIIDKQIDVIVIDPFVSCHEVPENDNTAQDMVVKEWGRVAERGNCAVHLVDHTRKMGGFESEVTTEKLPGRQGQDRRRPGGARRQPDVQGGGREGGGRKPPPLLPDLQRQGQPRAASRQVGLVRTEKRGSRQRPRHGGRRRQVQRTGR